MVDNAQIETLYAAFTEAYANRPAPDRAPLSGSFAGTFTPFNAEADEAYRTFATAFKTQLEAAASATPPDMEGVRALMGYLESMPDSGYRDALLADAASAMLIDQGMTSAVLDPIGREFLPELEARGLIAVAEDGTVTFASPEFEAQFEQARADYAGRFGNVSPDQVSDATVFGYLARTEFYAEAGMPDFLVTYMSNTNLLSEGQAAYIASGSLLRVAPTAETLAADVAALAAASAGYAAAAVNTADAAALAPLQRQIDQGVDRLVNHIVDYVQTNGADPAIGQALADLPPGAAAMVAAELGSYLNLPAGVQEIRELAELVADDDPRLAQGMSREQIARLTLLAEMNLPADVLAAMEAQGHLSAESVALIEQMDPMRGLIRSAEYLGSADVYSATEVSEAVHDFAARAVDYLETYGPETFGAVLEHIPAERQGAVAAEIQSQMAAGLDLAAPELQDEIADIRRASPNATEEQIRAELAGQWYAFATGAEGASDIFDPSGGAAASGVAQPAVSQGFNGHNRELAVDDTPPSQCSWLTEIFGLAQEETMSLENGIEITAQTGPDGRPNGVYEIPLHGETVEVPVTRSEAIDGDVDPLAVYNTVAAARGISQTLNNIQFDSALAAGVVFTDGIDATEKEAVAAALHDGISAAFGLNGSALPSGTVVNFTYTDAGGQQQSYTMTWANNTLTPAPEAMPLELIQQIYGDANAAQQAGVTPVALAQMDVAVPSTGGYYYVDTSLVRSQDGSGIALEYQHSVDVAAPVITGTEHRVQDGPGMGAG